MIVCVRQLTLWRLAIPMRRAFEHATASRSQAEPLVVQAELSNGAVGFGETHPRPYVSGESTDSAIADIRDRLAPHISTVRGTCFPEALEAIDALPLTLEHARACTAARAGVELALIDAFARGFGRPIDEVAGWLGLPGLGTTDGLPKVRFSGVIGGDDPARVMSSVRKMRCFGLRDFKLKVGDANDDSRLRAALSALGERSLRLGRRTLRLDANGGWSLEDARRRLADWAGLPVVSVEQPLPRGTESEWHRLRAVSPVGLMADESLVTPGDAEILLRHRVCDGFNIRLSKNGGLMPALRLAGLGKRHGIAIQLGCMVGETSILSAVGRWFLSMVPGVRFAEGSFGRFLLRDDLIRPAIRFGYGGGWTAPRGPGWGIQVDAAALERLSETRPIRLRM